MNNHKFIELLENFIKEDKIREALNQLLSFAKFSNNSALREFSLHQYGRLTNILAQRYLYDNYKDQEAVEFSKIRLSIIEEMSKISNYPEANYPVFGSNKISDYFNLNHKFVEKYRLVNTKGVGMTMIGYQLPKDHIGIELKIYGQNDFDHFGMRYEESSGVLINLNKYSNALDLLNDIYLNYLQNIFKPFKYFDEWVLVKETYGCASVALPISVLMHKKQSDYRLDIMNLQHVSPQEIGIENDTMWQIYSKDAIRGLFGLYVNNEWIIHNLEKHRKQCRFAHEIEGMLEIKNVKDIVITDSEMQFKRVMMFGGFWHFGFNFDIQELNTEKVIIQK